MLAAAMFKDWHLPEDYVQAVLACTESSTEAELAQTAERLVRVFHGARALADALMTTDKDPVALCRVRNERLAALRASFGFNPEEFAAIWDQVASDWREWGKIMSIEASTTTTPRRLVQLAERAEGSVTPVHSSSTALDAASAAQTPAAGEVPASEAKMRVLVVEDDPVSRKLIAFHLKKEGHTVLTAEDGQVGLKLALEHNPHLIVTDWMMPEMDGIELVRAIRRSEESRHMQVILLTGRESEARVVEAFDAGADEYLVKPFNPRILLARVRSAQRVVGLRDRVNHDAEVRKQQVAEMAVLNRKLSNAAMTDALTELPNRRHAMERMQQEMAIAIREGTPLSVIMIDIDKFKLVNDEHGHDTGDVVLCDVASSLRSCVRATELICRLGGEEFLVICPRATAAKAALIAERMRLASEANVIEHGNFRRAVTLSLGVAELDRGAPSVDLLIKAADERVYEAKLAGRNRVVAGLLSDTSIRAAS
jgi:diguanylate cyclase (GGDEF)-like protein